MVGHGIAQLVGQNLEGQNRQGSYLANAKPSFDRLGCTYSTVAVLSQGRYRRRSGLGINRGVERLGLAGDI